MSTTPRLKIPFPAPNQDPWEDIFVSMVLALDTTLYAGREDRNLVLMSTATASWNASSGVFSWDAPIDVLSPISGYIQSIPAGSVTLADGGLFYVTLARALNTNANLTVTTAVRVPTDNRGDDQFLIAIRRGNALFLRNGASFLTTRAGPIFGVPASGSTIPDPIGVQGAVLLEDPIGTLEWRRLTSVDIDPDFNISSFILNSLTAGTYERGETVTAGSAPQAALTYASGPPTSGTITNILGGSVNGSDVNLGSWAFTAPFANGTTSGSVKRLGTDGSADPTLTIRASTTKSPFTRTSDLVLRWTGRNYAGLGAIGGIDTVNAAFVTALPFTEVRTDRLGNLTVSPNNQYVYKAVPADYGTPTFSLSGFPVPATVVATFNVTNAFSVTRSYRVLRSDNLLTGTGLAIVVG